MLLWKCVSTIPERERNVIHSSESVRSPNVFVYMYVCVCVCVCVCVYRAIFVLQGPLTPFARNAIATCEKEAEIKMEMFQDMDLLMNITEHALVPQHTVLTEAEKRTLLDRYRVQQTQLPRIQYSDPIARFVIHLHIHTSYAPISTTHLIASLSRFIFLTRTLCFVCC